MKNFSNKMKKSSAQSFVFIFLMTMVAVSLFSKQAFANNLIVSNFNVSSVDTVSNNITFTCDISWENGWNNATNHDAAWLFVKYSTDGGASWSHASMSGHGTNPSGFSAPAGFEIVVPQDEKGFFLQRTDYTSGSVNLTGVRFVWDYGQDGLTDAVAMASNTVDKIFGIEMVYVPEGSFYAGDGNSSSPFRFTQGVSDADPWYIQSENAFSTANITNDGYYYLSSGASGENNTGDSFLIQSSFPKGYHAFYSMKYELTEGQWVSFFNTLSPAEKSNHDITSATDGGKNSDGVVNRNTIAWDSTDPISNASTQRPARPVTYLSWVDLAAYADWAGLRPLTELEFEKMARGKDVSPVADEFAWGSTTQDPLLPSEIYPNSDENGGEQTANGANINRNNLAWTTGDGRAGGIAASQQGPVRAGIFAETGTNRVTSGAGYYGNMELSGNLSEIYVSVGKSAGRQFLGTHGDGKLSTLSGYEGYATNIDWPGINTTDSSRGITGTNGIGYRGGDFASNSVRDFQISSRSLASSDPDSLGKNKRYDATFGVFQGGRLGRTAP